MEYVVYLIKSALKSMAKLAVCTVVILILWSALYHLTDFATVIHYFWIGVAVCALNTLIFNLMMRIRSDNVIQRRSQPLSVFHVQSSWIMMAGVVLVLYYAGFTAAAVFASAVIFASPFFGATIYDGIVGLSLLITLVKLAA